MTELSEAATEVLTKPPDDAPRRRGRPRGSKNKPRDVDATVTQAQEEGAPFVYVADPISIMQSKVLATTVWYIAAKMLPVRELTDEEGSQLGEALDPVLCKWIPILGEWKYEVNLLTCIVMLYLATKKDNLTVPDMEAVPDATGSPTL
jgi:hypothetical protein